MGEVPEQLPLRCVVFLGVEAELVAGAQGSAVGRFRFVNPALMGQTFGKPECAGKEDAFTRRAHPLESTFGAISQQQSVVVEIRLDRIDRADHPLVVPGEEPDRWQ